MNDERLRRAIAELARDSSNILLSFHARQRMRQRHVLWTQVQQVLVRGRVVESAHMDIHGCWRCTLQLQTAGDIVKVASALVEVEQRNKVVVVTVMN